jgi:hypothetical protein
MRSALYDLSISATRADALFASALQCSDEPSAVQVEQAIAAATLAFGDVGCAARVAQEFGEHPETAVARMRWARMVAGAIGGSPSGRGYTPRHARPAGLRPVPMRPAQVRPVPVVPGPREPGDMAGRPQVRVMLQAC